MTEPRIHFARKWTRSLGLEAADLAASAGLELDEWQKAGVWERLHRVLLDRLREADKIDWSRAAVDSSHVRAVGAGEKNRAQLRR